MMKNRQWQKLHSLGILWSLLLLAPAFTHAQGWPAKPVRVITTFGPGSGVEIVARLTTQVMGRHTGQTFVIDPRAGAGGTIATGFVASAPADGHTLLVDTSAHTSVPALMGSLPFDVLRDFSGVTTVVENPLVLVASSSDTFKSIADVVTAGKARPGKLTFASAGMGTSSHLSFEKFRMAAGFDALHVPFKSTPDAVNEILGGRVNFIYTAISVVLPNIRDSRLVPLAMSARRSPVLSSVPSIAEAGYPAGVYASWIGIMVSSKTPREVVTRIHQETLKALATQELKDQLAKVSADIWTMSPEEFDTLRRREVAENDKLVKAIGIKVQ
jgi:tripartite-type tricarboxylate transporter receptor subunit TctC